MEPLNRPEEGTRIAEARMSFSGNLLIDRQFDDVIAVTGIVNRRIHERGSFVNTLNDYSNAVAREEPFNAAKADTIIRDLYKVRFGESMNETRERLMAREEALFDRENNPAQAERQQAYQSAISAAELVEHGTKMTFHRALSHEAAQLAQELGITHIGAKKLISESYNEIEGQDLHEFGKTLDDKFYRPQIEAEKRQRQASRSPAYSQQPSYS